MWKRIQRPGREREKQIGNPILIETTYDEQALGRIPNISDLQPTSPNSYVSPTYASPAYASPPYASPTYASPTYAAHNITDVSTELPTLPLSLAPPKNPYRLSDVPTASSVYSQPSPAMNYEWPEQHIAVQPVSNYADISPPSSPEMGAERNPRALSTSRDVSPVGAGEDGLGSSRREIRTGSHIPVLRKQPAGRALGKEPVANTGRGRTPSSRLTRWDDFSGEPTTNYAGKPAQVIPGSSNYAPYAGNGPQDYGMGYRVSVSAGRQKAKKNPFSERAARFGSKGLSVETKPREEWRGASGRTTIVQPLADKPSKMPLTIPPQSYRRPSPGMSDGSGRSTPSSATITVRRIPMGADTSSVSPNHDRTDTHDAHEDPIKPTVPLKVGRNSPPRSIASPASPYTQKHPYPSPITPSVQNQIPTYITPSYTQHSDTEDSHSDPSQSTVPRKSIESTHAFNRDDNVPVSRFSWTTYATNTTYQHSPPPSPPPAMPTATIATLTPTPAISVINHRRPVPSVASTVSTPTTRKPVASQQPHRSSTTSGPSPRFSVASSKALPRPPPELESVDHVTSLEAQLDDLRLRRRNVNKLLDDLNATQPQNPLVTDLAKRREVERRRKEFEDELAEIGREEHDVGLKLHRAWRRREREGGAPETTLWIRRVTK